MTDLMARFVSMPEHVPSAAEITNDRPKLRAAYTEFKKRKKVRA